MLPSSPRLQLSAFALAAAFGVSACSGGSSSGDSSVVEGLTIAEQMSVVTVDEPEANLPGLAPSAQAGGIPPNSPYATDESRGYVYDPSMDSLQTVNMILCILKQTAYSGLLNEGYYKAQIDEQSCQSGGESGGDTGQSSGSQQALSLWVVESARASNTSEQTLQFWIPENENGGGDGPSQTRARMSITEGVSDENPFGVFDLNWLDSFVDTGDVRGFGNLHTLDAADGYIGFSFYEEEGDVTQVLTNPNESAKRIQANVQMTADQSGGVAHIVLQERNSYNGGVDSGIIETSFRLAFDLDNMLRAQDMDTPVCLSRTEFAQNTWRYNLYDSTTGERITVESGFGFQTENGDYGYAGYHGLWAPENVEIAHGDVVTRQVYGEATAETYTVFQAPGKLIRKTRNTLSTANLANVVFEWFDHGPPGYPNPMPYRTHVEFQAPNWVVTEFQDMKSGNWQPVEPPYVIPTNQYGFLGMWCPELGGSVSYVHGHEYITYFVESVVTPTDPLCSKGNVTLYGYFECLDGNISSEDANSGDIYQPNSTSVGSPYAYVLDVETMTLHLQYGQGLGFPAGLAPDAEVTQGPYTWGMRSGPLVPSTSNFKSTYDIWQADVFYTYETGQNQWNRYTTLIDELGDAVSFDPPISFSYTHSSENDANGDDDFDGRTFLFQYDGVGNLHGIPSVAADLDGNGQPDRYLPMFSLADGTIMGDDGQYVVRAIESEYTLREAPGACGALSVDDVDDLPLPDDTVWTDPEMGATPEVLDAPRVIEGVVVGSNG